LHRTETDVDLPSLQVHHANTTDRAPVACADETPGRNTRKADYKDGTANFKRFHFPLVVETHLASDSYACAALVQGSTLGCVQLMYLAGRS
jgi:hypothetical protein